MAVSVRHVSVRPVSETGVTISGRPVVALRGVVVGKIEGLCCWGLILVALVVFVEVGGGRSAGGMGDCLLWLWLPQTVKSAQTES